MPPYYSSFDLTFDFVYTLAVLAIGFMVLWLLCKIVHVRRSGIPELGAILFCLAMSTFHLDAILWAVLPFLLGFVSGRSTNILLDPTNITSPKAKLSDEEYAFRAEQYQRIMQSWEAQRFFADPYRSATDKLTLLFEEQGFGLYRHARGLALLTSLFYFAVCNSANQPYGSGLYVLLCLLSLPFGHVMGLLWKYIKGHPGPPEMKINEQLCKPTIRSFVISTLYSLSPIIGAGILTYFSYEKGKTLVTILAVIAGIFTIYLLCQTVYVHLQKIGFSEEGIIMAGTGRPFGIRWAYIEKAVIRERHNLVTGVDKLLILYLKQGNKIAYPISILSKRCENEILREVRKRVPTSSMFDNPSL